MRSLNKIAVASAVVAAVGISSPVMAQAQNNTISGNVDAKLSLTASCAVNAGDGVQSGGAENVEFGTIDFGVEPGTFIGDLTAQATGSAGATKVICTPDIDTLRIKVGPGNNANATDALGVGSRAMASSDGDYIKYEVYSKSDHTDPYESAAISFTISDNQPFDLPLYGKVTKSSGAAWPKGDYTDSLLVELDW